MSRPWLILVALSAAAGVEGAVTLFRAGRLEAKGRLEESRSITRGGGLRLSACCAACAAAALAPGAAVPGALFAAAAVAALLAGLSRKPRPSGWLAALLFAAGVATALLGGGPRG